MKTGSSLVFVFFVLSLSVTRTVILLCFCTTSAYETCFSDVCSVFVCADGFDVCDFSVFEDALSLCLVLVFSCIVAATKGSVCFALNSVVSFCVLWPLFMDALSEV